MGKGNPIPGLKDENGNWNTVGHPGRIVFIGKKELALFAKVFDGSDLWQEARLPIIHANILLQVLERFYDQEKTISSFEAELIAADMWNETFAQQDGTIVRDVHFAETITDSIVSGPHIGVANPLFKTSRAICTHNSDYDVIDLLEIGDNYRPRYNYSINCSIDSYSARIPEGKAGDKYTSYYRVVSRRMLNQSGERTLIPAIIPPMMGHINTVFGLAFNDTRKTLLLVGLMASIPYDFFIRATGKSDAKFSTLGLLPYIDSQDYAQCIIGRSILLNSLTREYSSLVELNYSKAFSTDGWSKSDNRLSARKFTDLTSSWTATTPLRTDYERRQALIELDVLSALSLGMTLEQLKTIYKIQFPVLQSYENDTWYDTKGRITFTNNRGLVGICLSRYERGLKNAVSPVKQGFEPADGIMKNAPAGYVFERVITDDTMPGGPIERTIQYVAPFDRCNREQDYETAWKFFEEKYGKK